jgi:hypothetical protein
LAAEGSRDADELRQAETRLQEIRQKLAGHDRDSWGTQLLKEARADCWEAHRQAREAICLQRERLQDLEYSRLRGLVAAVESDAGREDPFDAFRRIKCLHRDVSQALLSRSQREDVRSGLRSAREKASVRADEHRQKGRDRLRSMQSMFEEMIERRGLTIRKLEATITDLRGKEIWNDQFGERVADSVAERERRITGIEDEIRELERKLTSVRERLGRSS